MEIKRRPILTVNQVKTAALTSLRKGPGNLPEGVFVADHSEHQARWVGDVSFTQITMSGPITREVRADLFAVGDDHDYTAERTVQAIFQVTSTRKPFTLRYSMRETPSGIAYLLRTFEAESLTRELGGPVGVNYAYISERSTPEGCVTRDDLVLTPNNREYLDLNEAFTSAMLKTAGLQSEEPQIK